MGRETGIRTEGEGESLVGVGCPSRGRGRHGGWRERWASGRAGLVASIPPCGPGPPPPSLISPSRSRCFLSQSRRAASLAREWAACPCTVLSLPLPSPRAPLPLPGLPSSTARDHRAIIPRRLPALRLAGHRQANKRAATQAPQNLACQKNSPESDPPHFGTHAHIEMITDLISLASFSPPPSRTLGTLLPFSEASTSPMYLRSTPSFPLPPSH